MSLLPLYERVRVEIYLPDSQNKPEYQDFLERLRSEFAWAFGGCSIIRGVQGIFRDSIGTLTEDRVNVLYTDISLSLEIDFELVSRYADTVREAVISTLNNEEAILVTASKIYWSG